MPAPGGTRADRHDKHLLQRRFVSAGQPKTTGTKRPTTHARDGYSLPYCTTKVSVVLFSTLAEPAV